ncbi:MAG: dihydrolipoyl dehydrogenase, partial [Thermoanaerobaculia bacterium]
MAEQRDLVIIGSGPGGYVAAIRAAQLGLKVSVVEKDPVFGGTCLHRGCIPTKALLRTAGMLDEIRSAERFGIEVASPSLDLEKAQAFKQQVVDKSAKGIEYLFKKYGVEGGRGRGRLVGSHEVEVAGEGGTTTFEARHILIATGSVPRQLPFLPTDGKRVLSSDDLLEVSNVPSSLVVLGAGAVGCEFASIFNSFGTEVVLVEMLPRVLPLEDEEISRQLQRSLKKRGIKIHTGSRLKDAVLTDSGLEIEIDREDGGGKSLTAEALLMAVGRAPVTSDLGLEALGIRLNRGYVEVNELMQTDVPHIYAIGDVVDTPWLAHVASAEGILVAEHLAGRHVRPIDYDRIPAVTYCEPEVASVGLTEAQAIERGYEVTTGKFPFTALAKAAIEGHTEGFVKIVRETRYDELLGVHIIGRHATDLIAEACVALQVESTTEELFRTIHAHPTLSEAVAEAAHAAVG